MAVGGMAYVAEVVAADALLTTMALSLSTAPLLCLGRVVVAVIIVTVLSGGFHRTNAGGTLSRAAPVLRAEVRLWWQV